MYVIITLSHMEKLIEEGPRSHGPVRGQNLTPGLFNSTNAVFHLSCGLSSTLNERAGMGSGLQQLPMNVKDYDVTLHDLSMVREQIVLKAEYLVNMSHTKSIQSPRGLTCFNSELVACWDLLVPSCKPVFSLQPE